MKNARAKILAAGLIVASLIAAGIRFYFFGQAVQYRQVRFCLGTVVRIDVCARRYQEKAVFRALDKAWGRLFEINERLNVYNDKSDVARINRSFPDPVKVSCDTYRAIQLSLRYGALAQNAFDVTIRPLITLWKDAEKTGQLPTDQEVRKALGAMGTEKIQLLPNNEIRLLDPDVRLDLSAIGQGYAADKAAAVLSREGLRDFLVDAGGEILVRGRNARGRPWAVGVRDPRQADRLLDVIFVTEKGVSTSGDYEKYFEINGERYSHILDPKTGYPVARVPSVTVLAETATEADVYSTAFCVLGAQAAFELIKTLPGDISALIVEQQPDGSLKEYRSPHDPGPGPKKP